MKKITIFIVMFFISISVFAQGNGFIKATHTNNIDTKRRDVKTFTWELMGRYSITKNIYIFGYGHGNNNLYNLTGGISFKPNENLRFEAGAGAEFLEIPGQSARQIGPAYIFRAYAGDNTHKNNLWVNVLSGTRVFWQSIYIHQFNNWMGAGVTAEDRKGVGARIELSPTMSEKTGVIIFSNVFYNGANEYKKLGFDLVIDVGISLVF